MSLQDAQALFAAIGSDAGLTEKIASLLREQNAPAALNSLVGLGEAAGYHLTPEEIVQCLPHTRKEQPLSEEQLDRVSGGVRSAEELLASVPQFDPTLLAMLANAATSTSRADHNATIFQTVEELQTRADAIRAAAESQLASGIISGAISIGSGFGRKLP